MLYHGPRTAEWPSAAVLWLPCCHHHCVLPSSTSWANLVLLPSQLSVHDPRVALGKKKDFTIWVSPLAEDKYVQSLKAKSQILKQNKTTTNKPTTVLRKDEACGYIIQWAPSCRAKLKLPYGSARDYGQGQGETCKEGYLPVTKVFPDTLWTHLIYPLPSPCCLSSYWTLLIDMQDKNALLKNTSGLPTWQGKQPCRHLVLGTPPVTANVTTKYFRSPRIKQKEKACKTIWI